MEMPRRGKRRLTGDACANLEGTCTACCTKHQGRDAGIVASSEGLLGCVHLPDLALGFRVTSAKSFLQLIGQASGHDHVLILWVLLVDRQHEGRVLERVVDRAVVLHLNLG